MMGLTLSKQEASDRVSEIVVVPPRLGRNEPCHCGSGIKYKRCCWERDEALRRQLRGAALPEWIDGSRSKLQQFFKVRQQCLWPTRFISQPRRHPASTENPHLRRGQQLVSHGGAAHPEHQRLGRGFEAKRFSEAHWASAHSGGEGLQRRRGGQRSRQTRTGWHPQSARGGHRQSGAKQDLSRRLRTDALRGH